MCGAPNCARFIGFYDRWVIDEKGRLIKDFPVPRFLCQRLGSRVVVEHKTFSLLHYHLIPYHKYSIPFVIKVLEKRHIEGKTVEALKEHIQQFTEANSSDDDYHGIELSTSRIYSFRDLIKTAIDKIRFHQYYKEQTHQWQNPEACGHDGLIKVFLEFCRGFECHKTHPPIRGPTALSYDFYLRGGAYVKNSHFLFGTPSQFRNI